ncbi:unnamed protein product [Bemisia tabaci]|uniref:alkaline phosphatase n=1 Tax=Bemisia tabaci TaxID=7038 RepID=A0A9P0AJR3_BEMTA|nr:unnamed protein product [Bemisia tabaci]
MKLRLGDHRDTRRERAKNVVLLVADGAGLPTFTATRIFKGQRQGKQGENTELAWDKFPAVALVKQTGSPHRCHAPSRGPPKLLRVLDHPVGSRRAWQPRSSLLHRDIMLLGCSPTRKTPYLTCSALIASAPVVVHTLKLQFTATGPDERSPGLHELLAIANQPFNLSR